jgi:lipoprotein-anchoring transpeptidase ErfK/SrfK
MINRLNKYPISPSNKHKETQLINTILRNNGYPPHTYTHKQVTNKITNTVQQQQKQKWATFTYTGNQTRAITKLFKNSNIRIAYRTNNTIRNYLQNKDHNSDKYSHSGIY